MFLRSIFNYKITVDNIIIALFVMGISFPVRFNYNLGPFSSISLLEITISIVILYAFVKSQISAPIGIGNNTLFACIIIPMIITMFSLLWTTDVNLTAKNIVQNVFAILCYLAGVSVSQNLKSQSIMKILGFIFCCWLLSSIAMYARVPGFGFFISESSDMTTGDMLNLMASIYSRFGHPFIGQSNDYAPILAFMGFVFWGWYLHSKQIVYGCFAFLAFIGALLSFSRGTAMGLILGMMVYVYMSHFKTMKITFYLILISCAFGVIIFFFSKSTITLADRELSIVDIVEARLSSASIDERLEMFKRAITLIEARPLLGYGAGVTGLDKLDFSVTTVHNTYLERFLYYGIIFGLITIICLISIYIHFLHISKYSNIINSVTLSFSCLWICYLITALSETFLEASVPRSLIYLLLGLCYKLCFIEDVRMHNSINNRRYA